MVEPKVVDLKDAVKENENFREVIFTGSNSQLVIMSLKPGEDIGLETHDKVDQILYAVKGKGTAILAGEEYEFEKGSVICVPAGTEHNIVSDKEEPLKLFTVYSPPEHAADTIQKGKPVAQPVAL